MPLYTDPLKTAIPGELSLEGYKPSTWEQFKNAFDISLSMNPTAGTKFVTDMAQAQTGLVDFEQEHDFLSDSDYVDFAQETDRAPLPKMPVEEQKQILERDGLTGMIEPNEHWTADAFNIVVEHKKQENMRNFIAGQASGWQSVATLPAALAGGMVDPVNLMSVAIPGLGEARLAGMLQRASGFMGRTGARLIDGAIAGGLSALAIEPVIRSGQKEMQADYTLAHSLMNLGAGITLGAVLKSSAGGLGEWRVNQYNKNLKPGQQPRAHSWEYVPHTAESRALMEARAQEIEKAMAQTDKGRAMTPDELRQAALDDAALWDSWYRNVAYHTKRPIREVYNRWRIEYTGGEPRVVDTQPKAGWDWEAEANALRELGLDEATIERSIGKRPNPDNAWLDLENAYDWQGAADLRSTGTPENVVIATYGREPVADVVSVGKPNAMPVEKFALGHTFDENGAFALIRDGAPEFKTLGRTQEGHYIILGSDEAMRINAEHKGFDGWRNIKKAIKQGAGYPLGKNWLTGTDTTAHVIKDGKGQGQIVITAKVQGAGGEYVRVLSSWRDDVYSIGNWLNAKQGVPAKSPLEMRPELGPVLYQSVQPVRGFGTNILSDNGNIRDAAHWEVRELDDVIASHDPLNSFARRDGYPAAAQERPYHSDAGEQTKVDKHSRNYEPDYVVSTDYSATGGAPVITKQGIVLSGNGRAMTLETVYAKNTDAANRYRMALHERASQFGIDAEAIKGMRRPMLVRVLEDDLDELAMAKKSRLYNQQQGNKLQPAAEGISRGRFIQPETLAALAEQIEEEGGIAQAFKGGRGVELVNMLLKDGVINESEVSALTANGKLNKHGLELVQGALRGLVVADYDTLSRLPKAVGGKLDFAVAPVMRMKALGPEWDLSGAIAQALRLRNEAALQGTALDVWLGQAGLFGSAKDNPVLQALALLFEKGAGKEIKARLEIFAAGGEKAKNNGGGLLPGFTTDTPDIVFRRAFGAPVATVDGVNFAGFNPQKRVSHEALQWAYDNTKRGVKMDGTGRKEKGTANAATRKIELTLHENKNLSQEEKAKLMQYMGELARFIGRIEIYDNGHMAGVDFTKPVHIPPPEKVASPPPVEPAPIAPEAGAGPAPQQTPAPGGPAPEAGTPAPPAPAEPVAPDIMTGARAQVSFPEYHRAIISFFRSADLTSAPHEMYHIIRRQLEEIATGPDADAFLRKSWRAACEFVGAQEGKAWTRAMEEKFAKAGERYLLEGRAPNAEMEPLFDRFKERFMEVYADADAAGLEISDNMRRVFNDLFNPPLAEAERQFLAHMQAIERGDLDMLLHDPALSQELHLSPYDGDLQADLANLTTLEQSLAKDTRELLGGLETSGDAQARRVADELKQELADAAKEVEKAEARAKFMEEYVACRMRQAV